MAIVKMHNEVVIMTSRRFRVTLACKIKPMLIFLINKYIRGFNGSGTCLAYLL